MLVEIEHLNRVIGDERDEVWTWRGRVAQVQDEGKAYSEAAQEKYDELWAQFLQQEEKLEICEEKTELALRTQLDYEEFIRREKGLTISEIEAKVREIMARYLEYEEEFGKFSRQYKK